jgi:hypothetical protein
MLTLDYKAKYRAPSPMGVDEVQSVADDLQRMESTRLIPVGATVIELVKRGSKLVLEAAMRMEVAIGPKHVPKSAIANFANQIPIRENLPGWTTSRLDTHLTSVCADRPLPRGCRRSTLYTVRCRRRPM